MAGQRITPSSTALESNVSLNKVIASHIDVHKMKIVKYTTLARQSPVLILKLYTSINEQIIPRSQNFSTSKNISNFKAELPINTLTLWYQKSSY